MNPSWTGGAAASCYWAQFHREGQHWFRFDTRIYLEPCTRPRREDRCIGAVIGKNPGSALPTSASAQLQPLRLDGDRFLPTVRAVVHKAFQTAALSPPSAAYVRVHNLFYLCNRDLRQAKIALAQLGSVASCPTERRPAPWRWFVWGGPDAQLDPLKVRFGGRRRGAQFFLDTRVGAVVPRAPRRGEFARHTQGMPHAAVVTHLAGLISGTVAGARG